MFKTLYAKLAAALVVLLGLIGMLRMGMTVFFIRSHLEEVEQGTYRSLAVNLVGEQPLLAEGVIDRDGMARVGRMLTLFNPKLDCYLLDPTGLVLMSGTPSRSLRRSSVSLPPVRRLLRGSALPILGDDPADPKRQRIFSAAPIVRDERLQGYLYVVIGGDYDSVVGMLQGSYVLRLATGLLVTSLLLGIATGLVLFRYLTRRLERLTTVIEASRQEGFARAPRFSPASDPAAGDEIDRLGASFYEMARQIHQQMRALEETDALRRELVANVSHDLRTPLASLRGYLQTLQMKEGLLSSEEQGRYVEIASKNTEKLVRLVDELFELAKLESREIVARLEPFNLAELAQDVLQKFQLLAEQKRVRLGCQYRDDLPFVMADIGLIERVLQNLLDNALRHTPEGGVVTIGLSPGPGQIVVRVTDTGSGVPEDAMPHIFDRHFRVGADDGTAGHGAGLGLAIVRRIVELHGSAIEATSAPGAGSTFSFPLPIHST